MIVVATVARSDCNLLVIFTHNSIKNSIGGEDPKKKMCRGAPNEILV